MAKETAEQKLLKIIEGAEPQKESAPSPVKSSVPVPTAQQVALSVKGGGFPTFSIPDFIQSIKDLLKGKKAQDKTPKKFGLKELNQALLTSITIFAVIFAKDFVSGMEFSKQKIDFVTDNQITRLPDNFLPQVKEVSQYLVSITRRNIFQPFEEKPDEKLSEVNVPVKKIVEKTSEFKLVGISWLDTPQSASALIENTTSGVTYFLRSGEKVNNVTVKEIYADAVILAYEDEEMEFRLGEGKEANPPAGKLGKP